ncbi:MAG: hypothetical protein ACJ78L_08410 [Chloroflexota bacterium]
MPPSARGAAASGWLPASVLGAVGVAVLIAYGTPPTSIILFAGYVALGIAVPGMLWVRFLRGRAMHISEDLTLGLVVGYCLEIATYIVVRAAGAPLLVLAWPTVTLLVFAAVPGLRRWWRGDGSRAPVWWSWSLAGLLGYLLLFSAGTFFAQHHLTGPDTAYVDMPYHLALTGELRNHVPSSVPFVASQPLAYHWFVYAETAATSWTTGIEPVTLLYRLSPLPMFVAFVLLTAATARRLTGVWWTGLVAVAVALFGTVAGTYAWADTAVFDTQTLWATWVSPTNLFGLALFAGAIVLFLDLVAHEGPAPRRRWLLAGLLAFGLGGAKASLLPLLIAGLVFVVVGVGLRYRRMPRSAVGALVLSLVALGFAVVLLFRGSTGGLVIGLDSLRAYPVIRLLGAPGADGWASVVLPGAALLVALVLWSCLWAGAFGLLLRRTRSLGDPRIMFLLGICAGGLGAVIVLSYPGFSQLYYLRGAAGAFGLVTAVGIAAIVPPGADRRIIGWVSLAAAAGAATVLVIEALGPGRAPSLSRGHLSGVLPAILVPVLVLLVTATVGSVVFTRLAHRRSDLRGAAPLLTVALVMGFSLPKMAAAASPFVAVADAPIVVPADGMAAARWLRDHSGPGDLIATHLHCLAPGGAGRCDARHFWVSAYSERHVLVEGWAYTQMSISHARELGVDSNHVPFWDPALLALNDRAFTDPSAEVLRALEADHGVRWLFADATIADVAALDRLADLRERVGDYAIYELRRS